MTKDVASVPE